MEKTPSVSPSKKESPDTKQFPRVPVADLVPYARNSRTHSPEQVARVAACGDISDCFELPEETD